MSPTDVLTRADALRPLTREALDALRSFLATLLGGEPALEAAAPEAASSTAVADSDALIAAGMAEGAPSFAVVLEPGWAALFGEAMLGEAVPPEEAADLVGEALAQAYGAVRTQFGQTGPMLPEVHFTVHPAGAAPALPEALWRIPFRLQREGGPLGGSVLLPRHQPTEPAPPPASFAPEPVEIARATFNDLGAEHLAGGDGAPSSFGLLADVELEVTVELGRRRLPLADVLHLTTGSVIELEKLVGEPLEVYANGRLVAEGEAVVIDEQFGVRITSLAATDRRKRNRAFL